MTHHHYQADHLGRRIEKAERIGSLAPARRLAAAFLRRQIALAVPGDGQV